MLYDIEDKKEESQVRKNDGDAHKVVEDKEEKNESNVYVNKEKS